MILASSTQVGNGASEAISYATATNSSALLVVKRVLGSGQFSLVGDQVPAPIIIVGPPNPNNFTFSFASISGRTYLVQYKDSIDDPTWQLLQNLPGDGTTKVINDPMTQSQRFYRVVMQ